MTEKNAVYFKAVLGIIQTKNGEATITFEDCQTFYKSDDAVKGATAAEMREFAGALLAAAQRIDPLPSTTPTPALTPDQLT